MSHNDAEDYAQRLYSRMPAQYRTYDVEQGLPLLALLRVIGEQVSNVRQDLDALWDNFFIETCDDWVVPYLGALLGTNLLAHPVGQSNRLDVRNTVHWRRSKGTPAMLRELAQSISLWPIDLAEFFQTLGWSQSLNHLRLEHPLTPDLRDPYQLSLLGHAADPFAHAADFKPGHSLDQARVTLNLPHIGRAAWGTPGRYQIKNVGFFVRRLQTFPLKGVTPATVSPGETAPADAVCFTFDPLFRETPLFVEASGTPLSRAAFDHAPWETFGKDVSVRQFGVLFASDIAPSLDVVGDQITFESPRSWSISSGTLNADIASAQNAFTFGAAGAGLSLDATSGMRLLDPGSFQLGGKHFVITALWTDGDIPTVLGAVSTLHAALGDSDAFHPGAAAVGSGQLILTVQTGRVGLGWPNLPPSPPAYFPGAVLAIRASRLDAPHAADTLYLYLPPAHIKPDDLPTYYVADEGSTYTSATFDSTTLARPSEGQIYPARLLTASTEPASSFTVLNRKPGGLRLPDPARFGPAGNRAAVLIEVSLFTGAFQTLGAVATIDQSQADYPELDVPDPWPAFTYGPSKNAINGTLPESGLLSIRLKTLAGDFVPRAELIVVNRARQSLLIYLPELTGLAPDRNDMWLFVADDGSTYFAPLDTVGQMDVLKGNSYNGLTLARASAGQVLPIPGILPLQQRKPVAINLCRCERNALLQPGQLGIDPELGRFALAPADPAIGQGGFSVDYVEAFSDRVGARVFDRLLDPKEVPTRLVALSGDASSSLNPTLASDHIHANVADAVAAAVDGDVIEIVDSATYAATAPITIPSAVKTLVLRAGSGQRPCLTFYQAAGTPASGSLQTTSPMDSLELNGLLISGGPLQIESNVKQLLLAACTLDPLGAGNTGSLVATDANVDHRATYLLCRCITGGLRTGAGISQLIVADSIVDQRGGLAIGGVLPPVLTILQSDLSAQSVQLERATVFGRIRCDILQASETLLDDLAFVDDRQAGCIRFSRYESGSVLPRRYQCVPSDEQASNCSSKKGRCFAPLFNSRRFGDPAYAQFATACPQEILIASEERAEVGAFASTLNTTRLGNLEIKLQEFLPVGLSALVIAET